MSYQWLHKGLHEISDKSPAYGIFTGMILGLRSANKKRCYFATTSLNGWMQA